MLTSSSSRSSSHMSHLQPLDLPRGCLRSLSKMRIHSLPESHKSFSTWAKTSWGFSFTTPFFLSLALESPPPLFFLKLKNLLIFLSLWHRHQITTIFHTVTSNSPHYFTFWYCTYLMGKPHHIFDDDLETQGKWQWWSAFWVQFPFSQDSNFVILFSHKWSTFYNFIFINFIKESLPPISVRVIFPLCLHSSSTLYKQLKRERSSVALRQKSEAK